MIQLGHPVRSCFAFCGTDWALANCTGRRAVIVVDGVTGCPRRKVIVVDGVIYRPVRSCLVFGKQVLIEKRSMSVEYIYLKEMEIDDMKKNMIPGLAVHMMQFFQARVQNGGCFSQDAGISNFFIKSHQASSPRNRT